MKTKTKKIVALVIAISVLGAICTLKYMAYNKVKKTYLSPDCQLNTIWMYKDIVFSVERESERLGKVKIGSNILNIKALFGKGFDTSITLVNNDENTILSGYCDFKKDSFTMEVSISSIDYIKVGDKITFKKVDELPDWAIEAVEATVES